MGLNQKQQDCITMLIEGTLNKSAISKTLQISRTTLYNWLNDDEFKAEMDSREQDIKNFGNKIIMSRVNDAIEEYWQLRKSTTNEKVKEGIYQYFIDRALGKATSKHELSTKIDNVNNIDQDVLEAEFEEWESNVEEDE